MHIIPIEESIHPVVNSPSILFIKNISTGKTYYFAFNHPDSIPKVDHSWFINEVLLNNTRKWVIDKKSFTQMLNLSNVYDVNLINHLENNDTFEVNTYDTVAHSIISRNCFGYTKLNLAIPISKHKEMFDDLAIDAIRLISNYKLDVGYLKFNEFIIEPLKRLEEQGIYVNTELFKEKFKTDSNTGFVYSQYNVYTSTGRPSNRFGGINYAALNHNDGSRACFCSRYGNDGRMVLLDYTAFHPRIICYLTKYNIPLETNIYTYLARLYFQKDDVTDEDMKHAKQLTFRQFFGGVEDKYEHIKYLANLKSYIDYQWTYFKNNGYVLTPLFNRKISEKHIIDPTPPKVFNYILQAVEGELSIPRIKLVLDYLTGKKTKAVLYTYDAVLYDFHKEDGISTLNELQRIMSIDNMFSIKTYIGHNYNYMSLI